MSIVFANSQTSGSAAANFAIAVRLRAGLLQGLCALLVVFVSGALHAQNAQTIYSRMGQPIVLSAFGRPLLVKIPLDVTQPSAESAGNTFSLGPRPANADLPYVESAEVSIERQGEKHFLVIRSRQPVDELAIGIVIREQLLNGVRSREFTLLLDPAPIFEAATSAAANAPVVTPAAAPPPSNVALVQAAIPAVVAKPRRVRPPKPIASATAKPRSAPRATGTNRAPPTVTASSASSAEPRLRLSPSVQELTPKTPATEEMRAELRRRQLILDTDDLTSALLERGHRITLLEKELAALVARVSATERTLSAVPLGSGAQLSPLATAPPTVAAPPPPAAAVIPATPAATVVAPQVAEDTPPAVPPEAVKPPAPKPRSFSTYAVLIGLTLLLVLFGIYLFARRRMEARDQSRRLAIDEAEAYSASAPTSTPSPTPSSAPSARQEVAAPPAAVIADEMAAASGEAALSPKPLTMPFPFDEPPASPSVDVALDLPEINFDLPTVATPAESGGLAQSASLSALSSHFEAPAITTDRSKRLPGGGVRGRRLRYLECRYQDIVMLKPRLDAPESVLNQANRLRDEGAHDFAKRLLKYAAYSRPQTEAFWLSLLEALFQEKFRNDFVVNAKWFHEHHPRSMRWQEVQRFGHRIAPDEALFAASEKRPERTPAAFSPPPPAPPPAPVAEAPKIEFDLPPGWSKPMEDL